MEKVFDISDYTGLTEQQVRQNRLKYGTNEIPSSAHRSLWEIALEVLREPMLILLIACGGIYLFSGELRDALFLLSFVLFVIGITFYQERRTHRAIEALRNLSSPRAVVIRSGKQKRIPGQDIVSGDTIILSEGDRVPADGVILWSANLGVDESTLTGESGSIQKNHADKEHTSMGPPSSGFDCFVYSGSLVVSGQGVARILAVGTETELGKIGRFLEESHPERTPLQVETTIIVRKLAATGLIFCTAVVIIYGLSRFNWIDGFLAGLALAMAILPEELPVILTIFLALGAWRMSRQRVLTRRVPAIETLGETTILCVDKTGTLTMNRMYVSRICVAGNSCEIASQSGNLPDEFHEVVEYAILASRTDPFDPMEKALHRLGSETLENTEHLHHDWQLVFQYPLTRELLAISHAWQASNNKEKFIIAAKGAPEAIADLCHMSRSELSAFKRDVSAMADAGLRVIGVAKAILDSEKLPPIQHDFEFRVVGLIGFSDPVRPGVVESMRQCYTAGLGVMILTGDYPGTAVNIARQVGLRSADSVITGIELENLSETQLQEKISNNRVFARILPASKLRIVNALKARGHIVAMTGDGVNDAPALKSAHIGIAMGSRGTDVAREAADLVLLDDNFSSIVSAIRMGRRIFDNIQKAIVYTFAVHIPIAGMALLPVLFGWPLVLLPVHIVFMQLIIDPVCSIVFEAQKEEHDIMARPPRNRSMRLFNRRLVSISLTQGLTVLAAVTAIFFLARYIEHRSAAQSRAIAFTTLIISNLGLVLVNLSWKENLKTVLKSGNVALWIILFASLAMLAAVLYIPLLAKIFAFEPLYPGDLLFCIASGILTVMWFELLKMLGLLRHEKL